MAFVSKADAKVRSFFELPKLFRSFFKKFFLKRKFISPTLFQNFNLYRISLDCGCKGRAFLHSNQMHETLFCNLSATFYVSRWFTKDAVEHNFIALVLPYGTSYIIIYTRACEAKRNSLSNQFFSNFFKFFFNFKRFVFKFRHLQAIHRNCIHSFHRNLTHWFIKQNGWQESCNLPVSPATKPSSPKTQGGRSNTKM